MTERTLKLLATGVVITLAGVVAAVAVLRRTTGRDTADPGTRYDFGKVVQGEVVEHVFTVPNAGVQDLVITRVTPVASTVTHVDSTVPAGGSGRIGLRLDTRRRRGAVGEVVRVDFAAAARPVWLTLRGRVVAPVELAPQDRVYFFTVTGHAAREEIRIINHLEQPLAVTGVRSDNALFRPEVDSIEPGREYRIRVALDSTAPVGRYQGSISVSTDSRDYPVLLIGARAFVRALVSTSLAELDYQRVEFDALDRMAVARRTVRVERHGGTDFRVLRATTDVACLDVAIETENPGTSYLVQVRIVQSRAPRGRLAGTLVIQTNDPTAPEFRLPISGEIL